MHNTFQVAGGRRWVLLFMAAGLAVMMGASFVQRFANPHLVVEAAAPRGVSTGGGPGVGGMDGELGALMRQVGENPNDLQPLVHLTEHLVTDQQWDAAETFARRAMVVAPSDTKPLYLLGVILHNKGQHQEAADALENVLRLKDEASVRYSLGVLYIYYLSNVPKGVAHLSAGLHDPAATAALKASIREELEKAPLPGNAPAKK